MATTFGLDSSAADRASPMNRRTNWASSDSSGCAILIAMTRSSRVSVPRYTVAVPPRAIRELTRYRPLSSWPTGGERAVSIGNSVGAGTASRLGYEFDELAGHRRRGSHGVTSPRNPAGPECQPPGDHCGAHGTD